MLNCYSGLPAKVLPQIYVFDKPLLCPLKLTPYMVTLYTSWFVRVLYYTDSKDYRGLLVIPPNLDEKRKSWKMKKFTDIELTTKCVFLKNYHM